MCFVCVLFYVYIVIRAELPQIIWLMIIVSIVQGSRKKSILVFTELESQKQARICKAERRLRVTFVHSFVRCCFVNMFRCLFPHRVHKKISQRFLPRDAMRKRGLSYRSVSVRLSVCHDCVLYRDG